MPVDRPMTIPMEQPLANQVTAGAAPRFYVTPRQRISSGSILLAIVLATGGLSAGIYALSHTRYRHLIPDADVDRCNAATAACDAKDAKDDDDPSKVDTIYLGDPADAPSPGRPGNHVSPVHPFIIVHLPRFGDQVGLIPDTAAGRMLYAWLAAFNQSDPAALAKALPKPAPHPNVSAQSPTDTQSPEVEAQMDLRKKTGGYNLLSAKEVKPGVLVFRLRDQTPAANEALGTLQVVAKSNPPSIATFSLREIPSP